MPAGAELAEVISSVELSLAGPQFPASSSLQAVPSRRRLPGGVGPHVLMRLPPSLLNVRPPLRPQPPRREKVIPEATAWFTGEALKEYEVSGYCYGCLQQLLVPACCCPAHGVPGAWRSGLLCRFGRRCALLQQCSCWCCCCASSTVAAAAGCPSHSAALW